MSFSCECCVLSGRGLCDEPIPHPEESYRLWRVVVRDLETSRMRRPWPALGCCASAGNVNVSIICPGQWLNGNTNIRGHRRTLKLLYYTRLSFPFPVKMLNVSMLTSTLSVHRLSSTSCGGWTWHRSGLLWPTAKGKKIHRANST